MIDLNPSQLASEVATLLLLRGTELPPLEWHHGPNRAVKLKLEQVDDTRLFLPHKIADEPMASAVRSLLFIWSGWMEDAIMFAAGAPDAERHYIIGLCNRHLGLIDQAKSSFQNIQDHPIYEPLAHYAMDNIPVSNDAMLQRMLQLLEFDQHWEAFAFTDLIEQTRAGKISRKSEDVVRALQCKEFELLFAHCYTRAIGDTKLNLHEKPKEQQAAPPRRKRPAPEKRRPPAPSKPKGSDRETGKPQKKTDDKPSKIMAFCPQCKATWSFPPDSKGKKARCGKCNAVFQISSGFVGQGSKQAAAPSDKIRVNCPKCRMLLQFPNDARGKTARCSSCSTSFKLPDQPAAAGKR